MPGCSKLSGTISHDYYFHVCEYNGIILPEVKLLHWNVHKVCSLNPQPLSALSGTEWGPNKC